MFRVADDQLVEEIRAAGYDVTKHVYHDNEDALGYKMWYTSLPIEINDEVQVTPTLRVRLNNDLFLGRVPTPSNTFQGILASRTKSERWYP